MRTLDKYVLKQFLKIFLVTVLGVPLLFIVINLTDSIDSFLRDGVSRGDVFAHYLYLFPYNMLVAFPIAWWRGKPENVKWLGASIGAFLVLLLPWLIANGRIEACRSRRT